MNTKPAAHLVRWWTRAYTIGLPRSERDDRLAEVESDLWESQTDPDASREILSRLFLGALDDVSWAFARMEETAPASLWWSVWLAATVLVVSLGLVYAPDSVWIRESLWAWPAIELVHWIAVTALIGLSAVIDLRLTTPLRALAVSALVRRLQTGTVLAAVVTAASGLLLYAADPSLLADNLMFTIKLVALAIASLNVWYVHAVAVRGASQWASGSSVPTRARVCAYCSLLSWTIVLLVSLLTPYTT